MKPGVYINDQGLLFAGETQDGGLVVVQVPLDLDGLEAAGCRILDHVYAARQAQREVSAAAGEKPKILELRRTASWN